MYHRPLPPFLLPLPLHIRPPAPGPPPSAPRTPRPPSRPSARVCLIPKPPPPPPPPQSPPPPPPSGAPCSMMRAPTARPPCHTCQSCPRTRQPPLPHRTTPRCTPTIPTILNNRNHNHNLKLNHHRTRNGTRISRCSSVCRRRDSAPPRTAPAPDSFSHASLRFAPPPPARRAPTQSINRCCTTRRRRLRHGHRHRRHYSSSLQCSRRRINCAALCVHPGTVRRHARALRPCRACRTYFRKDRARYVTFPTLRLAPRVRTRVPGAAHRARVRRPALR